MGKPKRRKGGKAPVDLVAEAKVQKFAELKTLLKSCKTSYENHLNQLCIETCQKIDKTYMDALATIPCNVQNMTVAEAIEFQEKQSQRARATECPETGIYRSHFERSKAFSEKRKTAKKDRKRSFSASAASKQLTSSKLLVNRAVSNESLLYTPSRFNNRVSATVVTPKFDVLKPLTKLARKPRPGEVLMSLSGSPLQNFANENKVTLSLGQGRVLTLDDNGIDQNLVKEMDAPLKETLKNIKEKIDEILRS